ncbi:MAG: Type 4 prepilin-like proteins leader peptide-processing enzyme [Candidatus Marinimicrobia bacterium]|nr:Type 4 prepilin-like proteins leader peptide-processing enzyme [Candidatus Neomarinimicrobiota bacterium]
MMSRDILALLAFIFGSILGSFLNVLIYRLPRNESIVSPPSKCPHCGYRIHPWENIPVIGYLIVRGRCRNCQQRISLQYPIVEFAGGLVAALVIWNTGLNWAAISVIVLFYLLGVAAIVDLRHQVIPDGITLTGILLGIILSSFQSPGFNGLFRSIFGILAGGGSLYLVAVFGNFVFQKESMGGGDIKLAAMFGAFLGWKLTLIGIFLGFFIGAVFGGIYLALNRGKDDQQTVTSDEAKVDKTAMPEGNVLPFGPSLALGAVGSLFWGNSLLNWYLTSFM